jgi:hypothetical protein
MKQFESSGLWFPADDSSNAVGGTLRHDTEGLNLRLLGSFRDGWSAAAERYPTIRGVVDKNPHGTFVTLFECLRTHSRISVPGIISETIRSSKAVIGSTHLPDGPFHFETLEVLFSYLKDWAGQSGIKCSSIGRTNNSVTYVDPDVLSFSLEDSKLELIPSPRWTLGMHQVSLNEEIAIRVDPVGDRSPAELGGDRIQVLQNLLSFATDTPNEIEDVIYHGTADAQGLRPAYHLVFEPLFRLRKDKTWLVPNDMLFTLRDSQEQNINIFQNWFDFTRRNPSFCTVYFANLYSEPRYLDDRFASLMQAFTLLTTTIGEVSERTKHFIEHIEEALSSRFRDDEREMLGHIIPTGSEIEMPHHLLRLLQENADTMAPIIEDMPRFVRSVSDTLAFFKRRSAGKRRHLEGTDLLHAMLKIRTLIKVLVLKELGFGNNAVKSLVMRNNRMNYLRTL